MTDPAAFLRPVPRWLRVWAILTVLVTAVVVVLGSLVTTFRVGMSDPVWPTEPWFLAANGQVWAEEPRRGFLIEHTHRLAAWASGLFAAVFAVGAWAAEPDRRARRSGLGAVLFLLLAYLALHGEMRAAMQARAAGGEARWPVASLAATGLGVGLVAAACVGLVRRPSPGGWVRVAGTVALLGVMVQGLIGGYRVYLDQLMGTQLAAVHGTFAQVVFAVMVAVAVLAAPRRAGDALPAADRTRVGRLALLLPAAVFVQLVWGVWTRHVGSPVAQRLHLMTAFVVTGLAVWLAARAVATQTGRKRLGFFVYHLLGIIAVQVALGVEAWMGKFAAAGPFATIPPELRPIKMSTAMTRTGHVLIGTALLATAVALALRVWRTPMEEEGEKGRGGEEEPNRRLSSPLLPLSPSPDGG